ncbi:MAG: hypothetical protein WBQ37_01935 [Candidatus Competibacter sp.]
MDTMARGHPLPASHRQFAFLTPFDRNTRTEITAATASIPAKSYNSAPMARSRVDDRRQRCDHHRGDGLRTD